MFVHHSTLKAMIMPTITIGKNTILVLQTPSEVRGGMGGLTVMRLDCIKALTTHLQRSGMSRVSTFAKDHVLCVEYALFF